MSETVNPETGEVLPAEIVPASMGADPVAELVAQVQTVQRAMKSIMHEGEHYGIIPGTPKPSLWKAGAEKLNLLFRLAPRYELMTERAEGDHLFVRYRCILTHTGTGAVWGEGIGTCSTREAKYATRKAARVCHNCGKPAIIKGKAEYGGGWICFAKKGGCGAKFKDGDQAIESQPEGEIENPEIADTWNTVEKMACKRALVAATLNATAASDIFTQDLEDMPGAVHAPEPAPRPVEAPKTAPTASKAAPGGTNAPRQDSGAKPARPGLKCPSCGALAVNKSKPEKGGGFYCWMRHPYEPGCGSTWTDSVWEMVKDGLQPGDLPSTTPTADNNREWDRAGDPDEIPPPTDEDLPF